MKFYSEESSTEKVVQAQRAARCKPRRIHPSHKKNSTAIFLKEVDSLGVGQFSNIRQNAALCSAIISKVHNGAVAVGRCEPRLTHAVSHPLSFAKK